LKTEIPYLHFWEVLPFKRAGVCEMFSKTTKIEKIEKRIEELLYEKKEIQKMKRKQKEIFKKGEERFLRELEKICAN
jgi:UDP-N-acetylglucosamine:LPS N-acetylglucosamine transferase